MKNTAFISGSINGAILIENKLATYIDGNTGIRKPVNQHLFSHLLALDPEFKEISFDTQNTLSDQLFLEQTRQEALSEALELMDARFSEKYRRQISDLLVEKVIVFSGLSDFLINRIYSTRLPKAFNPKLAEKLIEERSESLRFLYKDLELKSNLFQKFYTVFRLTANQETEIQNNIDVILSENSSFATFTMALYGKSSDLFDYGVHLSVTALSEVFPFINKSFFKEIKNVLEKDYKIVFEREKPELYNSRLINLEPYKFFGSSLKTIYHYYNDDIRVSSQQIQDIMFNNLLFVQHKQESKNQFKFRLYDQILDEIVFLKDNGPQHGVWIEQYTDHKESIWWTDHDIVRLRNQYAHRLRATPRQEEISFALVCADSHFINRQYGDAIAMYSNLLEQLTKKSLFLTEVKSFLIQINIGVKLALCYHMMDRREDALKLYLSVYQEVIEGTNGRVGKRELSQLRSSIGPQETTVVNHVHIIQVLLRFMITMISKHFIKEKDVTSLSFVKEPAELYALERR